MKSHFKKAGFILKVAIILGILMGFSPTGSAETTVTSGPFEITADGIYQLSSSFTGRITIANTTTDVKIIGSGSQNSYTDIVVQGGRTGSLSLTIENLNILGTASHGIDFVNAGSLENYLYISGENRIIGYSNGAGIHVPDGVKLIIDKADGVDNGKLTAKGGSGGAGIGGHKGSGGNITINGGEIIAEAGWDGGAGIGGGTGGSSGNITISGGSVTATGYYLQSGYKVGEGPGIGGGKAGTGGTITIVSGTVRAEGGKGSAGIGAGLNGAGGQIIISGGTVTATGCAEGSGYGGAAGIGGGGGNSTTPGGSVGTIAIEGGIVTALGGVGLSSGTYGGGAGIGGGGGSSNLASKSLDGTITISGGIVTATGKSGAAGIGGGNGRAGCTIEISDGTVTATGGAAPGDWEAGGAGIGGGNGGEGGTIRIKGGNVTATGAGSFGGGAGIGGSDANGGDISISGGEIRATGGNTAAGIGGGGNAFGGRSGSSITISGGIVNSTGGNTAAGIGGGGGVFAGGSGGIITISGGTVTATGSGGAGIGGGGSSSDAPGSGGTITISNYPIVIATGAYGADIGNANGSGTSTLKDDLNNDLSYIRLAVTYHSNKKSNVIVTLNDKDYITNQDGLTGLFINKNSFPSIGIKAEDLNVEAQINIAASQVQSRRENVELSYYIAHLHGLLLSSGTLDPGFSSDEASYTVGVGYSVASVTIKPTADATSRIKVNDTDVASNTNSPSIPLEIGENEIEIVVTAGDGVTKKTYTVLINRRAQIALTIDGSFIAENKVYDGTTNATISDNNLILAGVIGSDDVTLNAVVAFDDANIGTGTVSITDGSSLGGAQAGDYILLLTGAATDTADITPKALTITADAHSKGYGEADPELTYEITAGALVGSDQITGALTRVAGENVGSYAIIEQEDTLTAGDNYDITYVGADLTITQKALTITADAQSKVYGAADPVFTVNYDGFITGEDEDDLGGTLAFKRTEGEAVGDYTITPSGLTSDNYDITYETGTLTVTKKNLTITAEDKSKVYGAADPVFTVIGDGFITGEDEDNLGGTLVFERTEGEDVGDYTITPSGLTSANYDIAYAAGQLEITPTALTITVDAKSKTYGDSDPELTYAITAGALVGDDQITGTLIRTAGENAGAYAIGQGTLTAGTNYAINYIGADLTINKKALTITAQDKSKVYGAADPVFTVNYDGFITGEDVYDLGGTLAFDRAEGEDVGDYTITPLGLTSANYKITYETGQLDISPMDLTITVDAKSKTYGDLDPELTYAVTAGALVGDDQITGVLTRKAGENAGAYAIGQGTLTAGTNYAINYSGADLNINKKALTIRAEDKSKVYGTADPVFTIICDGFIADENESNLGGTLALDRPKGEDAGDYTITPSGLISDNYNITFVVGTLAIISNNADLSNLTLSYLPLSNLTLGPAFNFETTNYMTSVGNSVASITVTATSEDGNATIKVNTLPVTSGQASDALFLKVGSNIINVVVTAEDEVTTKTYTVNISRASGSNGIPAPPPPEISGGNEVEAVLDSTTGNASASMDEKQLEQLYEKAIADESGSKTIQLVMPEVEGASSYTLEASMTGLASTGTENQILLTTPLGTMGIPDNMLTGLENAAGEKAAITIGQGDKSNLPADVKAALGDRPLLQLTLTVDDRQVEWNNPGAPVTVSISYTPTAAELQDPEHIVIWYIDGAGKVVSVPSGRYDPETGIVTFTTTHFSHYAVAYVHNNFNDLGSAAWAKKPIEVMASKGIINGTGKTTYSPAVNITRADYLVLLVKTLGLTAEFEANFDDVKQGDYYYEALGIARKLGIAAGGGNNRFKPQENISRQDMMVMTAHAVAKLKELENAGSSTVLDKFKDKGDIAGYAVESLAVLVREGLIAGTDDRIKPRVNTTRAEAAVFLYRIYNK